MNDPSGLFPPLLLFLAGKALALGISALGAYGSAKVVDKIKSAQTGQPSSKATDAMNKVAPMVAAASAASTVPGTARMAPQAVREAMPATKKVLATVGQQAASAGQKAISAGQHINERTADIGRIAGATIYSSQHGDKIAKIAPHVPDFIEGATPGGPPTTLTKASSIGYFAGETPEAIKKAYHTAKKLYDAAHREDDELKKKK